MSYHIHHTTGIIMGITNRGEANRVLTVLTRDLGLVRANAQGIRKKESKLRFGTQQLSLCHCDFVLGKEYWRLIGVEPVQTAGDFVSHAELWNTWNRSASLLARLVPTDEPHPELYDALYDAYIFSKQNAADIDPLAFEHFLVLRILAHLGYWRVRDNAERALLFKPLSAKIFTEQQHLLRGYTTAINQAIRSSDL